MDKIRLKAYGKINLALDVLQKRSDGYHELSMIMQTVGVYDDIIIRKNDKRTIVVTMNPLVVEKQTDNLAYKAAKLMMENFHIDQGVRIDIRKRIPVAGGMGGGSADCAAVIKGMNALFDLRLPEQKLFGIGALIGADVPYCILGKTALAQGIGELLTPLSKAPQGYVIIAKPPVSVSAAYVYGKMKPEGITKHPDIPAMMETIKNKDFRKMATLAYNVMEEPVCAEYPVVSEIKQFLLNQGALNAVMSGSGPTVFGLFYDCKVAKRAKRLLKRTKLTEQLYLTKFTD